jgi:hypothetical protein
MGDAIYMISVMSFAGLQQRAGCYVGPSNVLVFSYQATR